MLALPNRLGGLGIDPCKSARDNHEFSVSVASPLASLPSTVLLFISSIF